MPVAPCEPPADPDVRLWRARHAAHVQHGNTELAAAARRELEVAKLGAAIRTVTARPLTDAQRARLILLLCPDPGGARAS